MVAFAFHESMIANAACAHDLCDGSLPSIAIHLCFRTLNWKSQRYLNHPPTQMVYIKSRSEAKIQSSKFQNRKAPEVPCHGHVKPTKNHHSLGQQRSRSQIQPKGFDTIWHLGSESGVHWSGGQSVSYCQTTSSTHFESRTQYGQYVWPWNMHKQPGLSKPAQSPVYIHILMYTICVNEQFLLLTIDHWPGLYQTRWYQQSHAFISIYKYWSYLAQQRFQHKSAGSKSSGIHHFMRTAETAEITTSRSHICSTPEPQSAITYETLLHLEPWSKRFQAVLKRSPILQRCQSVSTTPKQNATGWTQVWCMIMQVVRKNKPSFLVSPGSPGSEVLQLHLVHQEQNQQRTQSRCGFHPDCRAQRAREPTKNQIMLKMD